MAEAAPEENAGPSARWVLALALLPALLPLWLIARHGVDVPHWDQWTIEIPTLIAYADGTLDGAHLLAQVNETRALVLRLAALSTTLLGGYDVRFQMALSVGAACATMVGLHALARQTPCGGPRWRLALVLVSSLLVFGLPQQQNWLWAVQLIVFVPPACLVCALAAAGARWRGAARAAACAGLCAVATFAFSSGVLVWPLVLVALVWRRRSAPPLGFPALAGFLLAAGATLALYFVGYESQPRWAGQEASGPLDIARFVAVFLGGSLGKGVWLAPGPASMGCGVLLAVVFLTSLGYAVVHREVARPALPWVLLAAFSVASGGAAALYRTNAGAERYLTTSLLFVVATAFVAAVVVEHAVANGVANGAARAARWSRAGRLALGVGLVGAVGLHGLASWSAYWQMRVARVRRLQGKAALAWILAAPEPGLVKRTLSPYPEIVPPRADALDRAGFVHPPLVRDSALDGRSGGVSGGASGELLDAVREGDELVVTATARLRGRGEPADVVLLCRTDASGAPRVFALAWDRAPMGEAGGYKEAPAAPDAARFVRRLPASRVPDGAWTLSAWAYDAVAGAAYPLEGAVTLPR